jgi:NAD(P)-dependent dehydrogenase (short-subunit alcohol dehydrogenase family)
MIIIWYRLIRRPNHTDGTLRRHPTRIDVRNEGKQRMSSDHMTGKVCVVTGASRGVGQETALGLARMGATVVAVARDPSRGAGAVTDIKARSGSDAVHLVVADLSSQAAIRELAGRLTEEYERLHVLVNNAGAVNMKRSVTVDGIETTFAVNHLAYFLLTGLLLPLLKASAPSRIVNVSSDAHTGGKIRFDDLQGEQRYNGWAAYSQSKLANVLFTYELARRLQGTGVTANCLHPGVIATGFGKNNAGWLGWGLRIAAPFMTKPAKGAETSIYLASSPEVEGLTGKYFQRCKEKPSSPASYDEVVAARLWQVSAEMTGIAS